MQPEQVLSKTGQLSSLALWSILAFGESMRASPPACDETEVSQRKTEGSKLSMGSPGRVGMAKARHYVETREKKARKDEIKKNGKALLYKPGPPTGITQVPVPRCFFLLKKIQEDSQVSCASSQLPTVCFYHVGTLRVGGFAKRGERTVHKSEPLSIKDFSMADTGTYVCTG
ncbi:hypothetical protein OS493_034268 [Desmophyllum pertusum]|uniref:Uncharacterized protein n=1 Tax=Desmophyllum pertusum TaxID=174260 RepID=A0A9W9YVB7_9CNID|nr:hypothetical protein OS493_034268 [Desmophyllum pertusum]